MFTIISLFMEELSIIVCIHRIFGRKIKFDRRTISLIIFQVCILSLVNYWGLGKGAAGFTFVFIFIYCKIQFKVKFVSCAVSVFFLSIIVTALQFICLLLTSVVMLDNEGLRVMIADAAVLFFCVVLLPRFKVDKLRKNAWLRSKYSTGVFGFVGIVMVILLVQDKMLEGIQAEFFIFAVPAVFVLTLSIGKWAESQERIKKIEEEMDSHIHQQEKYSELLQKVRLRQHEFKNHLTAIFSTHYTYKTYEQLVEVQKEYCNKLLGENKYNSLLLIGDDVLAGFLYGKFQEMEECGVQIEYGIHANLEEIEVPDYYLIEILGILLDNAAEAYQGSKQPKTVSLSIVQDENYYCFTIRNRSEYVPYSKMEQWFQMDTSSKGKGRGLGLYYVKTLCSEWKMDIRCENIEISQKNWIQFTLIVKKADSQK